MTDSLTTRQRILEAVVVALAEGSPGRLRRSITIDEIAGSAGLARRTIYSHFETVDDLLAAAHAYLGDRREGDAPQDVISCSRLLANLYRGEEWKAIRAIETLGGTSENAEAVSEAESVAGTLVHLVMETGRKPYPPLDAEHLAALLVTTAGTALSTGWSPEVTTHLLLLQASALTFHEDSDFHANPAQELMDEVARRQAVIETGAEFPVLSQAVLRAALTVFDDYGFADSRLEDIARRCGLSMELISGLFGGKSNIARHVVSDLCLEIAARVGYAASPTREEKTTLVVEELCTAFSSNPSLADLMISLDPVSRRPIGDQLVDRLSVLGNGDNGGIAQPIASLVLAALERLAESRASGELESS